MLKKLKCLEAKARLAREMANAQVNSNNNNLGSVATSAAAATGGTLSNAPSPNQCSSTTEASEGSSMSAGLRVVKTEPMDYEMLHLEQNYNERTRLGDIEGQFATKTSSSCSSLSGSQQSSNSSPNTNTNPPQQRYQHVQIQTVPPRQGLSSSSNSSNSSNNQTAAHKVILTPRLEYLQMVQAGSGGGVAALSDRSSAVTTSTVTPQIIITRTLPSSHNNSTVTSSSTANASPNHHQQPHHIPRRHSASPSHHQRLTVTGRMHNSNSAPSSPPPLHQSSSVVNPAAHVTQHVRVIQNGRYYEDTLGATVSNTVRRQTASPPPLQHYSRSVPVSVSPAIGAGGHARRYMSQTQAPLPPPAPPPPPSPIVSTAINAAIAANGGGSDLAPPPSCTPLAVTGTSAGQQYLLTHTPTRKYVLTPSGSRQINVISANHSSSISSTSASASSQQMQHAYATTQHSTATSPSTSSLQHSSHHSSQQQQQQHHQYVASSSASASASASASFSSSSPSKTTPSTASSNHIFHTPVVSSSSGHHLHHSNTSTHYQHHQQHNHPNNHSYHQSNNNNNNTNANNNNNNNNNTVMRPPPPPPPPKIKHSTLGMNVNGALGIGGSGGLGGNNNNTTSNNNNPISHGNGLRSSSLASSSSSSAGAASSLPSCSSTAGLNTHCEEPSSSIPDLEFDGTTVLCRVCGDKASGFHYGVHSCEGCKGFFRRSIQQKIQYRPCTKNQQCSILRINRNRCQYCRLKKCIAVGMSRDAVRFGRVPKREKARIMAAMQQSTQNRGQQNALVTELDDQPRLMATVLRAHLDTCEFTREKVAALRQQAFECPTYSMPTLLACPLNPAPEFSSEMEFSQRFAYVIRGIIDFASKIPGFQFLNQDDKFTLLKAGLFDALFVRLFYMFDSSINSIICLNGEVIRRDDIQNGTNARFLVDSTFKFAERMNSMNLSDAEIGLFCAIVLFTPDRPGLRNIELIDKMYTGLKGCLQTIINQNRPDQPDFMSTLLDTIPDLRTLSTLHTEKLVVFRTEHKDLLRQQICPDENRSSPPKSPPAWEDNRMDVEAKSPLGSVSSTDSGDMDYQAATSTAPTAGPSSSSDTHHRTIYQQPSSLASSAPLLAATLSGTNALRNRANSGSSGDSNGDLDLVGSHAHLTQNGLTITPIIRAHSHQHLHPHHMNAAPGGQHRYRKLDSPTDSGIESGNERNECKAVSSGGSSSCSSPRSSVDDALDCTDGAAGATTTTTITTTTQANVSGSPIRSPQLTAAAATSTSGAANSGSNASTSTLKRQIVEDMPVLKRVLQAPPLYDTNSLMDEAYKPHKKFRALRHREYETTEADASTSTNINTISGTPVPAGTPVHQRSSGQSQGCSITSSPSTPPTTTGHISVAPQVSVSSLAPTTSSSPSTQPHHQSQLHIHLTRPNVNNSSSSLHQSSVAQPPQQQQQHSSLSSTHSVLAKSLMAEPRMTPEQMKRSDIIQNYIMRESSSSSLRVCSPHATGSRSPTTQHMGLSNHCYAPGGNSSPASSSSPNLHCASPSANQVTSMASPPPAGTGAAPGPQRWQGHSVITTTSVNQRQPSVSPNSNGSSSSTSSINSTTSSSNNSGCQYFQSPHSTSASVSPPRPSPSSNIHASPRLLELQVDIADSQQPLNLSKKSPTPPPSKLQALVAAATATQRYPQVSTDATITGTTTSNIPNDSSNTAGSNNSNSQQVQVHKLMLEA